MSTLSRRPNPIVRFIAGVAAIEDWVIVRTAFFALLAGAIAVLYIDYTELDALSSLGVSPDPAGAAGVRSGQPRHAEPGPAVTTDRALLDAPLTVALKSGGVLELTGTIDVGSYDRFAARGRGARRVHRGGCAQFAGRLGQRCDRDRQPDPREGLCDERRHGCALRVVVPAGPRVGHRRGQSSRRPRSASIRSMRASPPAHCRPAPRLRARRCPMRRRRPPSSRGT